MIPARGSRLPWAGVGPAVAIACLLGAVPLQAQDEPVLGVLGIMVFRGPPQDRPADEALADALHPLVQELLRGRGVPVADDVEAAGLGVTTQYSEIAGNARLRVAVYRRADGEILSSRTAMAAASTDANAIAALIAGEIEAAYRDRASRRR